MKWTDISSSFVHLQQGKVLIFEIKCVGVNIYCTTPKPSLHYTNIIPSIMAYIKRARITQGWK